MFSCSSNTLVLRLIFEDLLCAWSRARYGRVEERRLGWIRTLWEHLVCLSDQSAAQDTHIRVKTRGGESPDGLRWSSSVPEWSGRASWRRQSLDGIHGEWHGTDKGME